MEIIEITDFSNPNLDAFARLTERQLMNRDKPEDGLFIAESPLVIHRALDAGYVHIDTAQVYGNEASVGKAIRLSGVPRKDLFITTKLYRRSNSYEKARRAIDESLRALNLGYVDLLLLHEP